MCSGEQQRQRRGVQGGFIAREGTLLVRWNRPAHIGDKCHAEPMQMEGVRRGEGRRENIHAQHRENARAGEAWETPVQRSKRWENRGAHPPYSRFKDSFDQVSSSGLTAD